MDIQNMCQRLSFAAASICILANKRDIFVKISYNTIGCFCKHFSRKNKNNLSEIFYSEYSDMWELLILNNSKFTLFFP